MRYTIIQGPSFADIITGLRRRAFRRVYYAIGQLLQHRLVQSATGTSKQRGRFIPPQRINEMYHSKDQILSGSQRIIKEPFQVEKVGNSIQGLKETAVKCK